MRRPKGPLFLERASYRRRRVADAARILPVVAAVLFLLPLLWGPQATPEPDTAAGGLYVFAVWGGLIACAWALSRRLTEPGPPPGTPPQSLPQSLPQSPPPAVAQTRPPGGRGEGPG